MNILSENIIEFLGFKLTKAPNGWYTFLDNNKIHVAKATYVDIIDSKSENIIFNFIRIRMSPDVIISSFDIKKSIEDINTCDNNSFIISYGGKTFTNFSLVRSVNKKFMILS